MSTSSSRRTGEQSTLGYRLGRVFRLARKELTEVLRDRRTIFTLILMPLLLYPALVLSFRMLAQSVKEETAGPIYRVGFASKEEYEEIDGFLKTFIHRKVGPRVSLAEVDKPAPRIIPMVVEDLESDVLQGRVELALRPRQKARLQILPAQEMVYECELVFREDYAYGRMAMEHYKDLFSRANAGFLSFRLERRGLVQRPEAVLGVPTPLTVEARKESPLAVFVPLVLILMTITGAVYPAIDLTAGERERGTLEILVAAPIPRMSVLLGKYVAVLAVAFLTALVNLTAMFVCILLVGYTQVGLGSHVAPFYTIFLILGLLLLYSAFFSAVLLVVTSFARSFKEAQAYLVPLMLLSLTPGVAGLMPGLQLASPLAVVPLLNIVLLARDLLHGQAQLFPALMVIVSTAIYALLALLLAARLFGAEAVLYAESSGPGGWFRRGRRGG